jgi:anti-sigma factor RsiW
MNCDDVRPELHDYVRRRLGPTAQARIASHVQECAACDGAKRTERALDELLEYRLPRHAAPAALRKRLALLTHGADEVRRPPARWTRAVAPALAASFAAVALGMLLQRGPSSAALATLTAEAVNDHLRVLATQHPVDVESGGRHQVKPWFEGRLDFAPVVPAPEDGDLRLRGGAVGYVFDRKAAILVYNLRLHAITLLVVRPEGLPWPDEGGGQIRPAVFHESSTRGFNVVSWRSGGLGYLLVSDVNQSELRDAAAQLATTIVNENGETK